MPSKFMKIFFLIIHILISFATLLSLSISRPFFGLYAFTFYFFMMYCFSARQPYVSMKILAVLLYLGHFSKCCLHFIFKYTYPEPTGLFGFLPENWNTYFQLTMTGLIFIVVSIELIKKLKCKNIAFPKETELISQSNLTIKIFPLVLATALAITLISYFNYKLGIYIIGLHPKTLLAFPLNAIISWLIYIGIAISISILFWNSYWLTQNSTARFSLFLLVVFEASLFSISTLSRGMFIYHILPYVIIFVVYSTGSLKNKKIFLSQVLILSTVFVTSVILVNKLRDNVYIMNITQENASSLTSPNINNSATPPTPSVTTTPPVASTPPLNQINQRLKLLFALAIDRWVGLEGLMAVSTYPYRSDDLILHAITNTRKVGEPDFTETITKSVFGKMTQYSFSSLLGVLAYIFLTKNLLISFVVCLILIFSIIGSEHLLQATMNPLSALLVSFFVLNMIYQINFSGLIAGLKVMTLTFGIILIGYFINKYFRKQQYH